MYLTASQSRLCVQMFRALTSMKIHQATKVVSALIDSGKTFDGEDPHDIVKYLNACEDDGDYEPDMVKMFQHLSRDQRVAVLNVPDMKSRVGLEENHTALLSAFAVATLLMQVPELVVELVFNDETLVRPSYVVHALLEKDFDSDLLFDMIGELLECGSNAGPLLTAMMEHWSDGETVAQAIQGFSTDEMYTLLKSLPSNQRIQLYGQMDPEKVAEVLAAAAEDESTHVESTHVNKKPRHW